MKKIIFTLMLLTIAFTGVNAKTWKTIRIATEGAWPPFNDINKSGEPIGFEVDLAKEWCKHLKVKCTIVTQEWDGIIPGLLAKKYDAIVASMSITDERKKTIDFSRNYYTTPAKFLTKKGGISQINDSTLKGKTVGVQKATIHENFMNDNFKSVNLKSYDKIEEAYLDLTAGRIDIVFADSFTMVEGFLNKPEGKDYQFIGRDYTDKKWFGDGVGVGLRQGDDDLKALFNKAINETHANGTYDRIRKKYFDIDIWVNN